MSTMADDTLTNLTCLPTYGDLYENARSFME